MPQLAHGAWKGAAYAVLGITREMRGALPHRTVYAPKAAGFSLVSASFVLAPPTGIGPVTFGLGNRCSVL